MGLVGTYLGDDGKALEALWQTGFAGVVIEGFGAGHMPESCVPGITAALAAGKVIVVGSRTGAGSTLTKTYAFSGSERDLLERGVLLTGWLHPRKARILLAELMSVSEGSDLSQMRQSFETFTELLS